MKLLDSHETIVIVTGSGPGALEFDRPLAETLRARIDAAGRGHAWRRAVVVDDAQFLAMRAQHGNPAIAIGGPGVNRLAAEIAGAIPTVVNEEQRVVVQADFDGHAPLAACWGADATGTARAVMLFRDEGHLEAMLAKAWRFRADCTA